MEMLDAILEELNEYILTDDTAIDAPARDMAGRVFETLASMRALLEHIGPVKRTPSSTSGAYHNSTEETLR